VLEKSDSAHYQLNRGQYQFDQNASAPKSLTSGISPSSANLRETGMADNSNSMRENREITKARYRREWPTPKLRKSPPKPGAKCENVRN
jgi:hypothetical protein